MKTNEILKTHDDWYLLDISTPTHPNAKMAVDKDVWDAYPHGRVSSVVFNPRAKYIYAQFWDGSQNRTFHRYVLLPEEGMETDHITHGTMEFIDNRRKNLREVTHSRNCFNQSLRSNNRTGVVGVEWEESRKKWVARITIDKQRKYLGRFDELEDAIAARRNAEDQISG